MSRTQMRMLERPLDTQLDPVYASSNQYAGMPGASEFRSTLVLRRGAEPSAEALMGGPLPESAEVGGRDRVRYFRRPIMPYAQGAAPHALAAEAAASSADAVDASGAGQYQYRLAQGTGAGGSSAALLDGGAVDGGAGGAAGAVEYLLDADGNVVGEARDPGRDGGEHTATRTTAVQTMYRESEAQTVPYAPDYVVRPGSQPEVLSLEPLKFGQGLPADQRSMAMIEKIKEQREWMSRLPPMDSAENIAKRQQMMEQRELLEWGEREEEIDAMQAKRLAQLERAMVRRENDHAFLEDQRVEYIRQKKMAGKEKVLRTIQDRRVKTIRRLAEQRKHVEGKRKTRDLITSFANGGSTVYAPLVRDGVVPRREGHRVDQVAAIPEAHTRDAEAIDDLARSMPRTAVAPKVRRPEKRRPVTVAERRAAVIEKHVEEVDRSLKLDKAKATDRAPPQRFLKRVELPPPRPPTPSVEVPDIDENAEVAAILIQRLLRGRAVQNEMYEGKERRIELIRELQIVEHYNLEPERTRLRGEADREHREAIVDATLESIEGEIVSNTLDFLSNELVRHQQERQVAALVEEGEQTRRMREAKEAGLRQREERIREEEDARFRIVTQLHQQTADSYLDAVLDNAVVTAASLQAIHETRVKSERVIAVLDSLEDRLNDPAVIVEDLVSSYLLPNVENETNRREERLDELKFPLAAKQAVDKAVNEIVAAVDAATIS